MVPLSVGDADLTALDFDGRHAHARPEDEQINLVLVAPVPDVDGVGQDALIWKAVLQGVQTAFSACCPSPNSGSSGMHLIAAPKLMNRLPGFALIPR
ncbi:MAG TPA: hypothetical protein VIM08_17660 [Arthrobacter sp.]